MVHTGMLSSSHFTDASLRFLLILGAALGPVVVPDHSQGSEESCSVWGPHCTNLTEEHPPFTCNATGNFKVEDDCNAYYKCSHPDAWPCFCNCRFKFMYFDFRVRTCQFLAILTNTTTCFNAQSRLILYGLKENWTESAEECNLTTTEVPDVQLEQNHINPSRRVGERTEEPGEIHHKNGQGKESNYHTGHRQDHRKTVKQTHKNNLEKFNKETENEPNKGNGIEVLQEREHSTKHGHGHGHIPHRKKHGPKHRHHEKHITDAWKGASHITHLHRHFERNHSRQLPREGVSYFLKQVADRPVNGETDNHEVPALPLLLVVHVSVVFIILIFGFAVVFVSVQQ